MSSHLDCNGLFKPQHSLCTLLHLCSQRLPFCLRVCQLLVECLVLLEGVRVGGAGEGVRVGYSSKNCFPKMWMKHWHYLCHGGKVLLQLADLLIQHHSLSPEVAGFLLPCP